MHLLAIAKRIFPVFIRKYGIAQISRQYQDIKKQRIKKKQELSTRTRMHILRKQEKGQKWEKRSKKAKNSLGHPLARAKKEFIALLIKIKIKKILFQSLCY